MIWGGAWRSEEAASLASACQERSPTGEYAGAGLRCARARCSGGRGARRPGPGAAHWPPPVLDP
ncbi:hypothetical protein BE11_47045 [Sorangium cellulosum]|nr:hypothetical protein BE11_47045 [Sorangium cellulosum]